MKRISGLLFLVISLAFWAHSAAFAQKPRKILAQADRAYFNDDWATARKLYEKVTTLQPGNQKANFRLGYLLLEAKEPAIAVPYLEKANKLSHKFNPEYARWLAQAYHQDYNFEAAAKQYHQLLGNTKRKEEAEIAALKKKVAECVAGQELMKEKPTADVKNAGPGLNSSEADYAPILTNNDQTLLFTSRRAAAGNFRTSSENIFQVSRQSPEWSKPQLLNKPVNSSVHDAATALSADGKSLFLYRDQNNGDILETKRTGNSWSKPKPLPEPINSKAFEPSFFLVNDNQYAFFASDREGGFGGLDLYLTMKQPDGTWSEAMNLGANVNTEFDEDAPFVDANGVLFFSSQGHNSMGGFDIFSSTATGAAWTAARNLGYPINTPFDDIFFATTVNGRQAFFTSDRPGGLGDKDIYEATFRTEIATDSLIAAVSADTAVMLPEAAPVLPVVPDRKLVVIKGRIQDAGTNKPIFASLSFLEKSNPKNLLTANADSLTGNFQVTVDKAKTYNLVVKREGYFYEAENINVPLAFEPDSLEKNISLKKIKAGEKIVLRNIFFEYGKDVLTESSRQELDRLYSLMTENPKIKVEISGHTDNKGKPVYNQALSLKRARAVVNYLAKKGVTKTRMVAVGFGSRKPIASNRFEDGRKQNRRTEFKILTQ